MKNKVIIKVKKKLYNVIALPVLKKLFRILPISRNKIVFDNFCGKGYGGNPKYIADAILDSKVKDIDLIWLVDNFMPCLQINLFFSFFYWMIVSNIINPDFSGSTFKQSSNRFIINKPNIKE